MEKISILIKFLDNKLYYPIRVLNEKIRLDTEFIPQNIKSSPTIYASILLFMAITIFCFTDFICCVILSTIFPVMYSMKIIKDKEPNINKLLKINKYWILMNIHNVIYNFLYPIISILPGHYYFRIFFMYAMIRSDFYLSEKIFNIFEKYYNKFGVVNKINLMVDIVSKKIYPMTDMSHMNNLIDLTNMDNKDKNE